MKDYDTLEIWTITRRPIDLPGVEYAARAHRIKPGGKTEVAAEHLQADTLEEIRAALPPHLFRLPRQPGDDPVVVECWL
jgi:hypothetical protein